ncbi:MAG: hypothetical protein PHN88_12690 [Ignavibacteria bacterium]|nr:hypothetical protein [Ignavibacteria bacterium]
MTYKTINGNIYSIAIFDVVSITLAFLLPSFVHLANFNLYLLEPFRIVLIFSFLLRSRVNAVLLAILLPVITLLISNHPSLYKGSIIITELLINTFLIILFEKKNMNYFLACAASIIISKIFYYGIKYFYLRNGIMEGDLIATPIITQILVMLLLSAVYYFLNRNIDFKKRSFNN